jgi:hypothetical protein
MAQGGTGGDNLGTPAQPIPGEDGSGFGAGVFNRDGTATVTNGTFADNTVAGGQADGSDIVSLGSLGQDLLGPSRTSSASLTGSIE